MVWSPLKMLGNVPADTSIDQGRWLSIVIDLTGYPQ